jgi:hypothetical protein
VKEERVRHVVPPELIAEYERERTVVQLEPGDLEAAEEPTGPVEAAEYFLLESDLNRELWDELSESVTFELRQRKGTRMLCVVEVAEDGERVRVRASDGTYSVQAARPTV